MSCNSVYVYSREKTAEDVHTLQCAVLENGLQIKLLEVLLKKANREGERNLSPPELHTILF